MTTPLYHAVVLGLILAASCQGSPSGVIDADAYFASIDTSLFLGEPDEETGARLAALSPDGHTNPESLGSYFQGDMLLPASSDAGRNSLPGATYRWPNAVIPYTIAGSFTTDQLAVIQAAIANFDAFTCVRWVPRTTQADYVTIQNTATGCWATVGRVGGQQMINLQTPACLWDNGTTVHEMNHAIGFLHMHSVQERDSYVTINLANVQSGQAFNFDKLTLDSLGITYDYGSVMHYEQYAFSSNGQPTIVPKQSLNGLVMGQRRGLSWEDIWKINRLYNCTAYYMR